VQYDNKSAHRPRVRAEAHRLWRGVQRSLAGGGYPVRDRHPLAVPADVIERVKPHRDRPQVPEQVVESP
jgi:hypothetical protein